MRIDSHQHFWRYNPTDYVWMSESMGCLRRDFLPADLQPHLHAIGFDGAIAVQARQMVRETEWLLELARTEPAILGVVGWVDFESAELDEQLERLAADPNLRGVRELIHDMPDVDYALSAAHVRGVSRLQSYGLTYDLLLKPPHIRPATSLVRQLPEQPFVIDHLAKPAIAAGELSPWREDIRLLAECDNVCCKLSGMATEAKWGQWHAAEFEPYLDVLLEAFGPSRLMIGSDWPVCTLSGTYEDVMQIVMHYVARLSSHEQRMILGESCARFYRLPPLNSVSSKLDQAPIAASLSC
jgi:L-fuconolactonase